MTLTETEAEAVELLETLRDWAESTGDRGITSGWHTHIADAERHELTIAVGEPKVPAR